MRTIGYIASGVIVGSSLMIASSAIAGGFAIREQSTTGLGVAFADSAAGSDLSSMFWNPAAVTVEDGMNSLSSFTAIVPETNIEPLTAVGTDLDTIGLLAGSYFNYQLNSQLYVGMSINAPFGLVTEADNQNWDGAQLNRSSAILTMNAAPTIGYKITPNLSVAAGLQVQYIKIRLAQAAGAPAGPDAVIKGEDIGVGFTLGALYKSDSGTSIGVGFRSSIDHDITGATHVVGVAPETDTAANLKTPEMVTVSIKQQLSDSFAIMANYEWANWSRLQSLKVTPGFGGGADIEEDFSWKDSWFASVGAEMKMSEALTVRAGAGYEVTPIPDATVGARLPDSNRVWLSLGGSYKWSDTTTLDFGYSHIFFEDTEIHTSATTTALGIAGADVDNQADIISIGMRHKW